MSYEYDQYLIQHKANVRRGWNWIKENLVLNESAPGARDGLCLSENDINAIEHLVTFAHDESKTSTDEYEAYDAYFYGGNRSYQVVNDFDVAWLKHIHRNPHHWQHWILIKDDTEKPVCLPIPRQYIIEMICDWWSFSWSKGDLYEIFNWYDKHKNILMVNESKLYVMYVLETIKRKLDEQRKESEQP